MLDFEVCRETLTSCIIGLAAEECGRLSYDPDNVFEANELLDPEFPLTCDDDNVEKPSAILEYLCWANISEIVDVMRLMEKTWEDDRAVHTTKGRQSVIANRLWYFAKDLCVHQIVENFGDEFVSEFEVRGEYLFGES
ncbi:unknown [Feldmannia species virus]|uniref:Uncharacterized protein n=1 Tax=Feldmannia species virus TaxID=39420 RepID=B5LWM0_9PHYC|nr:hypothetical protein FeldSpV_gp131 [Feldmannia species virus]ACH46883.1 unknown [Feldmannia species virus]